MNFIVHYEDKSRIVVTRDGRMQPFSDSLVASEIELDQLRQRKDLAIVSIREDFVFKYPFPPALVPVGDLPAADNWGCIYLDAPNLAARSLDGHGVRVGIIDSGLDLTHPCLKKVDLKKFIDVDFDTGSISEQYPFDSQYHGTFCAAILCGDRSDGYWRGLAPSSELYVCKIFNKNFESHASAVVKAFDFMIENRVQIVSMSFGLLGQDDIWAPKIAKFIDEGGIIFAGIGNFFESIPTISPGNYPLEGLCAVGAHNSAGSIWSKSGGGDVAWSAGSFGPKETVVIKPDLVAPGTGILSVGPGGTLALGEGTSFSTPHVAGLAACILSGMPELTGIEVIKLIQSHLQDGGVPGKDTRYGGGTINAPSLTASV
jgi:subtilisin